MVTSNVTQTFFARLIPAYRSAETATMSPMHVADLPSLQLTLRAPLYQVVSYAEVILEELGEFVDGRVSTSLATIITLADTCIKTVGTSSSADWQESVQAEQEVREQLLEGYRCIEEQLGELDPFAQHSALPGFRSDLAKLRAVALMFRQVLEQANTSTGAASQAVPQTDSDPVGLQAALVAGSPRKSRVAPLDGLVLVVDDNDGNRDVLSRRLLRDGCEVLLAESGRQALRMVQRYQFDVILLDIMMPVMDGYSVLAELKKSNHSKHIPVIMISAVDEIESVIRCIELGADDYLYKPFNPVLLRARLRALLERSRLRKEEARRTQELTQALEQLKVESKRSDALLRNILPPSIAEELQVAGSVEPRYFEDVTIVFTDFVNFTLHTEELPTQDLVYILNTYFSAYDAIVQRYGLEKLKTIGDSYMFVGGMPERGPSHPVDAVLAAVEMLQITEELAHTGVAQWELRIGIHTGPVAAGVVGTHKFAFDIWGDAVNLSSRMESSSEPGRINVSATTYSRIKDFFSCQKRGFVRLKEGRDAQMYFVDQLASGILSKSLSPVAAFKQRYRAYFQREIEVPASLVNPVAEHENEVRSQ